MGDILSVVVIMLGLATAVFVLLTANPKTSRKLTIFAGILALLGGLAVYGYGYCSKDGIGLQAMLHALFSVFRIFIGDADFSEVADYFTGSTLLALIWLLHVLGFYATSSAAISLIGANALRNLRVWRSRKRLCIIYGVTENSVAFGQNADDSENYIYVDEKPDSVLMESILDDGSVLRSDPNAWKGNTQFLTSLGFSRKAYIKIYCLHPDLPRNIAYANVIYSSIKKLNPKSTNFSLIVHAKTDILTIEGSEQEVFIDGKKKIKGESQAWKNPDYDSVTFFQEADLVARLLIQKFPPCKTLSFNADCEAQDNFEALVIGFGQIGQTVLRHLIMNGQFVGSQFRADVFAPDVDERNGYFCSSCPGAMEHYDIQFHPHEGRSPELYQHLNERLGKLKYIAICTGDELCNAEIAEELRSYLSMRNQNIPIYQCSHQGIKATIPPRVEYVEGGFLSPNVLDQQTDAFSIYHPDVLDIEKQDRLAMAINTSYMGSYSKGLLQDWLECDYFSRASCRAYADFVDSILYILGLTEKDVLNGQWHISDEQKQILGQLEHARWNAFHFCLGFLPMSDKELYLRAQIRQEQLTKGSHGLIRITKNMINRTHACLVSWEDLVVLAQKEHALTGTLKDYQKMDIDNIMLIPKLLEIRNADRKDN